MAFFFALFCLTRFVFLCSLVLCHCFFHASTAVLWVLCLTDRVRVQGWARRFRVFRWLSTCLLGQCCPHAAYHHAPRPVSALTCSPVSLEGPSRDTYICSVVRSTIVACLILNSVLCAANSAPAFFGSHTAVRFVPTHCPSLYVWDGVILLDSAWRRMSHSMHTPDETGPLCMSSSGWWH